MARVHINCPRPRKVEQGVASELLSWAVNERCCRCHYKMPANWMRVAVFFYEWYEPHATFWCAPGYGCNQSGKYRPRGVPGGERE